MTDKEKLEIEKDTLRGEQGKLRIAQRDFEIEKEQFFKTDLKMTPFYYNGSRTFTTEEGQQTLKTLEGFFLEEVVDFAIGKIANEEKEQLVIRLKNKEDKDVPRQFPVFGKDNKVIKVETKLVRRDENSSHIVEDQDAILRWKKIFKIK